MAELLDTIGIREELLCQVYNCQYFDQRKKDLEEEIGQERRNLQITELQSKKKIEAEYENIAAAKNELDDRSHMHARREMREKITTTLRDRLKNPLTSAGVSRHRAYIIAICGTIASAFIFSAAFAGYELAQIMARSPEASVAFYVISLRLALSVAAFAATGFYLLGFLRKIHDSDLRSERDLERYLYDVDRSSWVIETVLEAQSKENGQESANIPDNWLQGVTHGLFRQTEEVEDNDKAMEVLASLFKFSAKAKLGPQGPEFEMNNAGSRKFSKENLED